MKKQLLILALVVIVGACSRNPDPEYAPDAGDAAAAAAPQADGSPAPGSVEAEARLSDEEAMRLGREIAAALGAQDVGTIWSRFDANMRDALESRDAFSASVERMFSRLGAEGEIVSEEVVTTDERPGVALYMRRSYYTGAGRDAMLRVAFNPDGTIGGMRIQPAD